MQTARGVSARRWLVAAIAIAVAAAAAVPGASRASPSTAGGGGGAGTACATINVDDLLIQAAAQHGAGFHHAALALVVKALDCREDVQMFRMAVLFACDAHDQAAAQLYFGKLPLQFQPASVQRCQQNRIALLPPTVAALPAAAVHAPPVALALTSRAPATGCDGATTDELVYDAADQFIAGDARNALATLLRALPCRDTVRVHRMAAIYACVAHDDRARLLYDRLPAAARPAVKQRCLQENVALDAPAAVPTPAPTTAAAAPAAVCATMNVDDAMGQAVKQYDAGFPRTALALAVKALGCRQDVRMYRAATLYACAARDAASAKLYVANVPQPFRAPLVQRCQQQGLALLGP
jgi:hypothetical protein